MKYHYSVERQKLFNKDGIVSLLRVRDAVQSLLECVDPMQVTMDEIFRFATGRDYTVAACVDFLIELGELKEVGEAETLQDRIFKHP